GWRFIHHTLAITDFRVGLTASCRARPGYELLEPEHLVSQFPNQTSPNHNPWTWHITVQYKDTFSEIGVLPDYAFAIVFPDGSRRAFLVECDLGKMPVARDRL